MSNVFGGLDYNRLRGLPDPQEIFGGIDYDKFRRFSPRTADAIVAIDGTGDYTAPQDAIDELINGARIYLKRGTYPPFEIKYDNIFILGANRELTKIQSTSPTTPAIKVSGARWVVADLTLVGPGYNTQSDGIDVSGLRGATDGVMARVNARNFRSFIHVYDNSWNNYFYRSVGYNLKYGLLAERIDLDPGLWNGENFITEDVWFTDQESGIINHGYLIKKGNASMIFRGQVLTPGIDGIYIQGNSGESIISETQFDVCGRHAAHVEDPDGSTIYKILFRGCWLKGANVDSAITDEFGLSEVGCGVYINRGSQIEISGGSIEALTSGVVTNPHYGVRILNSELVKVFPNRILCNGSTTLDNGVSLEDSKWCTVAPSFIHNVRQAVVESGTSDFNQIIGPNISGFDVTLDQVVRAGANTITLYLDKDGYLYLKRDVKSERHMWIGSDGDLKMGTDALRALVRVGNALNINYQGGFDGVDVGAESTNKYFKVWGTDIELTKAGGGLIVVTPDGTAKYRIRVDNAGALTIDGPL